MLEWVLQCRTAEEIAKKKLEELMPNAIYDFNQKQCISNGRKRGQRERERAKSRTDKYVVREKWEMYYY